MNRFLCAFVLVLITLQASFSQAVKGKLIDGDSLNPLPRASVRFSLVNDTANARTILADSTGHFFIAGLDTGTYGFQFSFTGYDMSRQNLRIGSDTTDMGEVLMFRSNKSLGNVVVVGRTPPSRQKGDTTELNASAFKVNPDATTEDLIRKAPGVTVENGVVTAHGEEVRKVTIDGRDFFGDDAAAALRNLPAEVVEKIQVFDRLSDQAQLTGVEDANTVKALNIITKANMRNGQFGRIYGGYGTDERYAAGGNVNIFSGNRRINIIGLFNNVNQQNFSGEDLLGVSGQANAGRGNQGNRGGRGGGNFGGGNTGNFQVGSQPGVARTNAIGVNFSDLWLDKKMTFTGSYFFNDSRTENETVTRRQTFLPGDSLQLYNETRKTVAFNTNHRVNMRMEYKWDSNNTLIIVPSVSFQTNNSTNLTNAVTQPPDGKQLTNGNQRTADASGYNWRTDINYRHAFNRKGRAITLSVNTGNNHRNSNTLLDAITGFTDTADMMVFDTVRQRTTNLTNAFNITPGITYIEPIGKGQLQANYNHQYSRNNADQENNFYDKGTGDYTLFDTTLSNKFLNTVNADVAGLTYRIGNPGMNFSAGVNYQATNLNSAQQFPRQATVNKTFENVLPNIQYRKNFSRQSNLRFNYRASVNAPSVNQLQNVINNTNPLFITTGNADLNQSYTHFVNARFNTSNPTKGTSFFVGTFLQLTNSYVTNASYIASVDSFLAKDVVLRRGAQLSKPVNLDGYRSARIFSTYGIAIKPIKTNMNLSAGFNYVRTPGMVNNVVNFSNNYMVNAGVSFASNISEYIDYNLSYSANFNRVKNSIQPQLNNRYYYHSIGLRLNLLSKNGWFILNDVTNQLYNGLAAGFDQNFWLWNVSAGKKFLKDRRGEIRASVFDLLKQNQSIARNVTENYIEDVQTKVLQQYFMFTFTYTLRNFGSKAAGKIGR